MVVNNQQCSACGMTMLLDHVEKDGDTTTFYYACVNPNCKERNKAYTATGKETESRIKSKE